MNNKTDGQGVFTDEASVNKPKQEVAKEVRVLSVVRVVFSDTTDPDFDKQLREEYASMVNGTQGLPKFGHKRYEYYAHGTVEHVSKNTHAVVIVSGVMKCVRIMEVIPFERANYDVAKIKPVVTLFNLELYHTEVERAEKVNEMIRTVQRRYERNMKEKSFKEAFHDDPEALAMLDEIKHLL